MSLQNKNKLVSIFFSGIFLLLFIVGLIYNKDNLASKWYTYTIDGLLSIFAIIVFPLLSKMFKIIIAPLIRILVLSFVLAAVYLGTIFDFYSKISFWDLLLHFSSGVIFTFIGFVIVKNLFLDKLERKQSYLFGLIVAVLLSFSIAFMWEILEFTGDSITGGNAQKFIPTVNGIYNGGNSNLPLLGDNKTIAEFFRRPEGYRYALFDTMYDMVVCFVGTMFATIVLGISYNFANAYKLDNLIKYQNQVVSTKI